MADAGRAELSRRAAALGIATSYEDARGDTRAVPGDTVAAVVEALSVGPGPPQADEGATRPRRCHLPAGLRTWGWSVQLPATRSLRSWGIGDLRDLRELAGDAPAVMVSPLHAGSTVPSVEPSPYSPSSRRFRHPIHLCVDEVTGADDPVVARLADEARAANAVDHVDRGLVWSRKLAALERLWSLFSGDDAFDGFFDAGGEPLRQYSVFCTLQEHFDADWHRWPSSVRRPDGSGVEEFAFQQRDRVRFHAWLQWLLARQLEQVASTTQLVQDLAVGFAPNGADAWALQDVVAEGMTVGAPPDIFNPEGQDWGLPAVDPWRLRAVSYEPWAQAVRANLVAGGGIRVDHILGQFRLFWIPDGASPSDGTYVRYPHRELLDVVAAESQRAQAFVVGEDLGTVPPAVRDELAARDILSYRLFWFEDEPPERYPWRSLAAVTTHDLPTIAGVASGVDAPDAMTERLALVAPPGTDVRDAIARVYGRVAQAPSALAMVTLEDALAVRERPNRPGAEDPENWSRALPLSVEALLADPFVGALGEVMRAAGR